MKVEKVLALAFLSKCNFSGNEVMRKNFVLGEREGEKNSKKMVNRIYVLRGSKNLEDVKFALFTSVPGVNSG